MPQTTENEVDLVLPQFNKTRAAQLDLCTQLENIADSLGGQVDRHQCAVMASQIQKTMNEVHGFEKTILFPVLSQAINAENAFDDERLALSGFLAQLKDEHEEDVCLTGEVVEALGQFAKDPDKVSHDAIGYLLRGFFVGIRRHLAFEHEVFQSVLMSSDRR